MQDVLKDSSDKSLSKDAENQVIVAVNDWSKSNKPTIDVIDKGVGLLGTDFENTILSINHGNKLSRDKSYLIGIWHGGSTSFFYFCDHILSKERW